MSPVCYSSFGIGSTSISEFTLFAKPSHVFLSLIMLMCIPETVASRDSPNGPFLVDSPNKKYAVLDINRSSNKSSERCHIYFIDKAQHKRLPLLLPSTGTNCYTHNVDFLWSPDSSKFVVNDCEGPGGVDSFLYSVTDIRHPIVISKKLECTLTQELGQRNTSLNSRIRLDIEVKRWINPKSLELEVDFAYTADLKGDDLRHAEETGEYPGSGFRRLYRWNLGNKFSKIRELE